MSDHLIWGGNIRKLWPTEQDKFRDHLLRLDKESRRLRFAHGVSDCFIEDYASRMSDMGSIVYAYFDGGEVRGAAELRKLADTWGKEGEAAFSVERAYQEQGVGSELMGRVIRAARNRGIHQLYMSCLAENGKCRRSRASTRPTCASSWARSSARSCRRKRTTSRSWPKPSRIASAT